MLIDSHDPPLEGARPAWQPNWRVVAWALAAAVIGFAGVSAGDAIGTLLVIVAFGLACRALDEALPYRKGLSEWKQ